MLDGCRPIGLGLSIVGRHALPCRSSTAVLAKLTVAGRESVRTPELGPDTLLFPPSNCLSAWLHPIWWIQDKPPYESHQLADVTSLGQRPGYRLLVQHSDAGMACESPTMAEQLIANM
jgi:hypothetical protein